MEEVEDDVEIGDEVAPGDLGEGVDKMRKTSLGFLSPLSYASCHRNWPDSWSPATRPFSSLTMLVPEKAEVVLRCAAESSFSFTHPPFVTDEALDPNDDGAGVEAGRMYFGSVAIAIAIWRGSLPAGTSTLEFGSRISFALMDRP